MFPDILPGFCAVIFKKGGEMREESLSLRFFSSNAFLENDAKIMKIVSTLLKTTMRNSRQDIFRMEDEELTIFMFPTQKQETYLAMLGFPVDKMGLLYSIDEDDVEFI